MTEPGIIDVNAYLSRWPCRRLPDDETPRLVQRLREAGIEQAWVSSFDALLHRDVEGVNRRLVEECRTHGEELLVPFGCVNPTVPDWHEDVRRCREEHEMRGVRLHPNYHGYTLGDAVFSEVLHLVGESELIVQIAVRMEDERTQHPLLRVPDVDLTPLAAIAQEKPGLKIMLLNALRSAAPGPLEPLFACENVWFDIARLEGVGGVGNLIRSLPYERVLFGSYAPFFYVESSLLKLRESQLGDAVERAVSRENARQWLLAPSQ